jgi:hypothetical protein
MASWWGEGRTQPLPSADLGRLFLELERRGVWVLGANAHYVAHVSARHGWTVVDGKSVGSGASSVLERGTDDAM